MLILTRKERDRIVIGDDVTLQVIKVGKNRVKLGVHASAECAIFREELGHERGKEKGVTKNDGIQARQPGRQTPSVDSV